MFPAILRVSLVLPYTQLELRSKNQLDELFILIFFVSVFNQLDEQNLFHNNLVSSHLKV